MNKTNNWTLKIAGAVLAGLAVSGAAGCQTDGSSVTDFFPSDNAPRATEQFMNVQAASGARADGTLQPLHFDAEKLNSLGEAKLDLMLKDDDSDDRFLNSRKESVTRYLVDRGLSEDQVKFETGTNPNSRSLAVRHITNMGKTETGISGGTSTSGASEEGAAASAGGMSESLAK